jgi:hypothetical protein
VVVRYRRDWKIWKKSYWKIKKGTPRHYLAVSDAS